MREASAEVGDAGVDIRGEVLHTASGNLPSAVSIVSQHDSETGDNISHFFGGEIPTGARALGPYATPCQRVDVVAAMIQAHTVQKESHLRIVLDDRAFLKKCHQVRKSVRLIGGIATPD